MPDIDTLTVRVEADPSGLKRGLREAEQAVSRSSRNMARSLVEAERSFQGIALGRDSLRVPPGDSARRITALEQTNGAAFAGAEGLASLLGEAGSGIGEVGEQVRALDASARDLGFTFASAFEDAVVEGRRLSDVIEGLEQDTLRILTRRLVSEPLANAVSGVIGRGQSLLGDVLGAALFHGGGKVGATPASGRAVPAAVFAGAPRFAGGGVVGLRPRLAPGEVPAILHRGETVRTAAQETALQRRLGGQAGDTPIVVNIQTPNPRAFNESRSQIEAMLADAVRRGRRNR